MIKYLLLLVVTSYSMINAELIPEASIRIPLSSDLALKTKENELGKPSVKSGEFIYQDLAEGRKGLVRGTVDTSLMYRSLLSLDKTGSIVFWIKFLFNPKEDAFTHNFISLRPAAGGYIGLYKSVGSSEINFGMRTTTEASFQVLPLKLSIQAEDIFHIVLNWKEGGLESYVNGELSNTVEGVRYSPPACVGWTDIYIGEIYHASLKEGNLSEKEDMVIGDVQIFPKNLNAEEVNALMNSK